MLDQYGADAFRWYTYTAGPPGEPRRFSVELVGEAVRNFYLTLWNVYSFFVTYANLDDFDPTQPAVPVAEREALDRWVLSELHALVRDVTEGYETYDVPRATRPIETFVSPPVSPGSPRLSESQRRSYQEDGFHSSSGGWGHCPMTSSREYPVICSKAGFAY